MILLTTEWRVPFFFHGPRDASENFESVQEPEMAPENRDGQPDRSFKVGF